MRTFDKYISTLLEDIKDQKDIGKYIVQDNMKQIYMTLQVLLTDNNTGAILRKIMKEYGQIFFTYDNSKKEAQACQDRLDKLANKGSELATELAQRVTHFKHISVDTKIQLDIISPEYLKQIETLIKEATANFAKNTVQKRKRVFKSLQDIQDKLVGEEGKQVVSFLQDVYRGGNTFKPFANFIVVEMSEGRNPMNRLVTIYKTVSDIAIRRGYIGNPDALFSDLIGVSRDLKIFAEPTAGRTKLKQADPNIAEIIRLIKTYRKVPTNLDKAIELVKMTLMPDEDKEILTVQLQQLKMHPDEAGLEGEIVQALYQKFSK